MTPTTLHKKAGRINGSAGPKPKSEPSRRLHLDLTEANVGVVTFDHPDKAANIFDEPTLNELNVALNASLCLRVKGLVFVSAKPSIFIAGADLDSLAKAPDEELERLIEKGQRVFQRIAEMPFPTVAAIHGACLGGGLELALACDRRLASDDKTTKIGLPETMLGILPAWGGSTRLPRLVGLPKALDLILGGKQLAPKHARKLGLVDAVVPKERLRQAALDSIEQEAPKRPTRFLSNNPLSAMVIRRVALRNVLKKSRGNYPALEEAVEVVTRFGSGGIEESLRREREAVLRLARTDAAANLMRVFGLQERAKKFRYAPDVDLASLPQIERTAVVGAGVMGSGIAQWLSARGLPVVLRDIDPERVAAGMKSVRKLFDEAVRKRIFTAHEASRRLDLVSPSEVPVPLFNCDLVVEAAIENLEVKKKIFADLCRRTSPETILATNTSALPVSSLCDAPGVTEPGRIVGLHFFNPVSRMKLVEVVVTNRTSPEVVERVLRFVRGIGKLPVVVKDSPGFLVNRILMPYLIEAGRLVDNGYTPKAVDDAMLEFGMPMGPLRLLDEVGLDVAAHVTATMREAFGDRFDLPTVLDRLVEEGRLGKKTGHGFYRYEDGKAVPAEAETPLPGLMPSSEISKRLASLMVEESRRCLDEGVVEHGDDIDLAMILGTGFAPFRGGPVTYGEQNKTN
ncbi:MAG: 3-hydroxyacyl-CoA dehydrogenase NAD-binding domain-containing protein [Verrucomicrobiales bacterium]